MLPLFKTFTGLSRGLTIEAGLDRLMKLQAKNISSAINYYNNQFVPIDMTSPIVRLCYRLQGLLTSDSLSLYNRVIEELEEICLGVGITTSQNKGETFDGLFYGERTQTILVSETVVKNRHRVFGLAPWKTLQPLRVIDRAGVKGSYIRPDLINDEGINFCTVGIDVGLLAYMYLGWHEENKKLPVEYQKRIEHFVAQYVYPSMMWSQMDAAIMRSLIIGKKAWEMDTASFPTNLALTNRTGELLGTVYGLMEEVSNQSVTWEKVLTHVPSFVYANMAMGLPELETDITPNNHWAQLAAIIPSIQVCLKFTPNNPEQSAQENLWRRYDRTLKSQRIIDKAPNREVMDFLTLGYDDILFTIG